MNDDDVPEELLPQEPTTAEQIHLALQGFYQALSRSVCDPICIPSGIPHCDYDKIYFDLAADQEDARRKIKERIRKHGFTIDAFIQHHERMVDILASVEEAANTTSTEKVKKDITEFIKQYREHIMLIDAFRKQPEQDSFLDYPHAHTTGLSKRHVRIVTFNPTHDYIGALKEACSLEDLLKTEDQLSFGPINATGNPYAGGDTPASGMDTSYRGRVEFVKIMLRRAGLTS